MTVNLDCVYSVVEVQCCLPCLWSMWLTLHLKAAVALNIVHHKLKLKHKVNKGFLRIKIKR